MSGVRKHERPAKTNAKSRPEQPPPHAPLARRKNLKLLILSATLLAGWLVFLAVMAFR
jgi:hypothetical protein